MKNVMVIMMIAMFALAMVSTAAFADQCPMGNCQMMGKHGNMCADNGQRGMFAHKAVFIKKHAAELGLTDEQLAKVETLEYNFEKASIKTDAEIKALALDIKEAVKKDTIDTAAVNALIDQKFVLKAQNAKSDIASYAELKAILTPDQQKKIKEIWAGEKMEKKDHWKQMSEGKGKRAMHEAAEARENE